ncbi:MAG: EAL domain-containing protein [Methanoregulaceae archaeon]|nr:EAL domain-containing protein [Methanoregulaceae archaeon]
MKLRKRLIIVSGLCLAMGAWAISSVALDSSARGFAEIEYDRAQNDVARINEAFRNAITALHTKSADWANWDDTYNFIGDRNREYVESNLDISSLEGIRIDLIMILSPQAESIIAVGVPDGKGAVPDSQEILRQLRTGKKLDPTVGHSGYVIVHGQPTLVSVRPVFRTGAETGSRGWILFAQRLDARLQGDLRRLTRYPIKFRVADDAVAASGSSRENRSLVKVLSEDELLGTSVAYDLFGRPSLQLDTVFNRRVYAYGKVVGKNTVAQVLAVAAFFALVIMFIFERFVLRRLRKLHEQVASIGAEVDGARVKLDGQDELASLANQVNTMLSRIEDGSSALRESEEQLRSHNENLEQMVAERTAEIERSAAALRESEERLRLQNENLEQLVDSRTREIEHQAFHDKLTGLPNRALFMDRLSCALTKSGRSGMSTAVMFIDLDNFKLINDSLGHDKGDLLLITVADRLSECVRAGDTVARLGGDEFTLLLEGVESTARAEEVADRILATLRKPIPVGTSEIFTGASIGLAITHDGHGSAQDLLKHADVAMYRAKATGKSTYVVFDEHMNAHAVERLELETALRKAIDQGTMSLAYQPIVDLASGQIIGVETLSRWAHPTRGDISPAQFIPIAEDTGLIVTLGNWVLEEACRQATEWIELMSDRPFTISVNVSGRQLKRDDIVERVSAALEKSGLPAERLKLELTETVLLDDGEEIAIKLRSLKQLGVKLALDDFGTGYSSLSTLRSFPIDTLKVDQAFIRMLEDESEALAIVEAITSLARTMRMDVTAEGVETASQERLLKQLGVSCGQGYFFARPMPAAELRALISTGPRSLAA